MFAPYPFSYKSVACTFLLLWMSVFLSADLFAGSFRTLGIKEGLGSRQVFQITKDSAGFVWVYTHVGIDRYDGNEIKHYKLDGMVDSRDHIQSSTTMMCDKEGIIWVALKNGKLYAYNRLTDSFQLRMDLADYLPSSELYNMLFDDENHLWLCMSEGLYAWDESAGLSLAGLEGQSVRCMVQMDDELFFAGTDKGLFRLTKVGATGSSSFETKPVDQHTEMHVESLYVLGAKLFIGTFSNGVFVLDGPDGRIHPLYAREDSGETASYDHAFCQQRRCHYETESRIYRASGGRCGGDEYVISNK